MKGHTSPPPLVPCPPFNRTTYWYSEDRKFVIGQVAAAAHHHPSRTAFTVAAYKVHLWITRVTFIILFSFSSVHIQIIYVRTIYTRAGICRNTGQKNSMDQNLIWYKSSLKTVVARVRGDRMRYGYERRRKDHCTRRKPRVNKYF